MKPTYEELEARCAALAAELKQSKIDADCYKKGMEASNARLVQLAAENAKLADCANFYRLGFKPAKGAFGIEYRPTEQLLDDCGNTALEAIKTTATDSFLDEVRASARKDFIGRIEWIIRNECNPEKTETILNELQSFSETVSQESTQ